MDFERGKSVKEAIGIGLFSKREFKDDFEAADFLMPHIKTIMGIENFNELPNLLTRHDEPYCKLIQYTVDYTIVTDGIFFTRTFDHPDESLLYLLVDRINDLRILQGIKVMSEKRGYVFREG